MLVEHLCLTFSKKLFVLFDDLVFNALFKIGNRARLRKCYSFDVLTLKVIWLLIDILWLDTSCLVDRFKRA